MAETIGFIGLGDLGAPVAANLQAAGYPLRVFNRTPSKADALVALGAERAASAADTASEGGVAVSLLWDDASVEAVVVNGGVLERLGSGGVHVSMSTVSPDGSKHLAALHAARGVAYVEAPIFGRPEAAAARQLWIAFAGPETARARVRPVLEAMGARGVFDFGETIGAATMVKLVGNFLLISAARSMAEALGVAAKAGYDAAAIMDMLTQTLFPAPIYQAGGRAIAAGRAALGSSDIPIKDLGLLQKTGSESGLETPIAGLLRELMVQGRSGG
jgi:3-hydroxyisobutyrate dehydrogenase-like beta-hydroxyacid dehydrogenase